MAKIETDIAELQKKVKVEKQEPIYRDDKELDFRISEIVASLMPKPSISANTNQDL